MKESGGVQSMGRMLLSRAMQAKYSVYMAEDKALLFCGAGMAI